MKKPNIYRILFWTLFIVLIGTWGYLLYDKNKTGEFINVKQNQIAFEKDSIRQFITDLTIRLDSMQGKNTEYENKLHILNPADTINATPQQKQIFRLMDSTSRVKDSIARVLNYMNDSIDLNSLSRPEMRDYAKTLNLLSNIEIKMDLTIDKIRLALLKEDTDQLGATIARFNTQTEKLKKLSSILQSVTKFITGTVGVLDAAIAKGLVISHAAV